MRITAASLDKFSLIDEILPEPLGGAHRDPTAAGDNALLKNLADLDSLDLDQLVEQRQQRINGFGEFKEG